MPSYNRVLLMGNLTRDPELRYLPSGMAVVGFGMAMNRRWRNQQGELQDESTFVDCDAFGRTAETINQYLRKGRPIFVEGRLKLDQWQDQQGNPRSKLKVIVESFSFVDSRAGGEGGEAGGDYNQGGGYGGNQSGGGGYPSGGGYPARGQGAAPAGAPRGGYNAPGQAPRQAPPAPRYDAPPQDAPDHVAPNDNDIPF